MEIHLIFPDSEEPPVAVGRLFSVFNGTKVDWKGAKDFKNAGVLVFNDDVPGVFTRPKLGTH